MTYSCQRSFVSHFSARSLAFPSPPSMKGDMAGAVASASRKEVADMLLGLLGARSSLARNRTLDQL